MSHELIVFHVAHHNIVQANHAAPHVLSVLGTRIAYRVQVACYNEEGHAQYSSVH